MPGTDWNTRLEYLKGTRQGLWNDDYFAFLVQQVWRLERPIRIVDFGCGYGYLAGLLLPLLPAGSSYTGLDMAAALLEEGRRIFVGSPYQVEFIEADLTEYCPAREAYDLAICQAFLRHLARPWPVLQSMAASVRPGGLLVCIEVNRRMENAGLYQDDDAFNCAAGDEALHRAWQAELEGGGRDYLLGSRVPFAMRRMGLAGVGVRINDRADFYAPGTPDEAAAAAAMAQELGLGAPEGTEAPGVLRTRSLVISYGTKPRAGS